MVENEYKKLHLEPRLPQRVFVIDEKFKGTHNSFLMEPVPSGSRTLKALTITSSGSAPDKAQRNMNYL